MYDCICLCRKENIRTKNYVESHSLTLSHLFTVYFLFDGSVHLLIFFCFNCLFSFFVSFHFVELSSLRWIYNGASIFHTQTHTYVNVCYAFELHCIVHCDCLCYGVGDLYSDYITSTSLFSDMMYLFLNRIWFGRCCVYCMLSHVNTDNDYRYN